MQLLPLSVSAGQNMTRDNFFELRNVGFAVDDKNKPVPENIHVADTVNAVANTTIEKMPLLLRVGYLMVLISGEHLVVDFFLPPN